MPHQRRLYEGKLQRMHQGLPWGSCQVPQCRGPADPLALYCQEARPHANTWIHVVSSTAHQLSWWWLPPSNHGDTHGAREEWTNLLHAVAQKKSGQIFFAQPKAHQFKFAETNKTVPTDLLKLIAFLSSVKRPTKRLVFLRRSPRTRSSQKRRRWLIFLSCAAMKWATSSIFATNIMTFIKGTNAIVTTDNPTIVIKMIDATIVLVAMTRSLRTASPTRRRMIASVISPRKRVTRPCTTTSPLCWAQTPYPKKGVALAQDFFRALGLGLAHAWAAGATKTIMWLMVIASQEHSLSMGIYTPPRVMTADVSIALTRAIPFLPPSPLQWQWKVSAPTNRESCQQRLHVSHLVSLFQTSR